MLPRLENVRYWGLVPNAVGLERGDRRGQLALDMVGMGVDQLEHQAIAVLGALQHPAQQHLVDPVGALPVGPVRDGAVAVVEREDKVGPGAAHALRRQRGHVAELVDRRLHPRRHFRTDVGLLVDDAADGLERNARIRRDMLDRNRLFAPRHRHRLRRRARGQPRRNDARRSRHGAAAARRCSPHPRGCRTGSARVRRRAASRRPGAMIAG